MNFRKLYENIHLREDSQINLEGVKFFMDERRSDYSFPSFKTWWSKRKQNLANYHLKDAPWAVPESAYYPTAKAIATVHIMGSFSKMNLEGLGIDSDPNDPNYKLTPEQSKLLVDHSNHKDSSEEKDKKAYFRGRVVKEYPGLIENADKWMEKFPKQFKDMFDDTINLLQHEADNILGNKNVSTKTNGKDPDSGANTNWKMTTGTWDYKKLKPLFGDFSAHIANSEDLSDLDDLFGKEKEPPKSPLEIIKEKFASQIADIAENTELKNYNDAAEKAAKAILHYDELMVKANRGSITPKIIEKYKPQIIKQALS